MTTIPDQFKEFPMPEEFSKVANITVGQAETLLDWVASHSDTQWAVSREACWMAAVAILNGLHWQRVCAVFASGSKFEPVEPIDPDSIKGRDEQQ